MTLLLIAATFMTSGLVCGLLENFENPHRWKRVASCAAYVAAGVLPSAGLWLSAELHHAAPLTSAAGTASNCHFSCPIPMMQNIMLGFGLVMALVSTLLLAAKIHLRRAEGTAPCP